MVERTSRVAGRPIMRGPVAFLFLGETLLIPHLYPIVEALAEHRDVAIELWVSTSVHEDLLTRWTAPLDHPALRIRRAPGYRRVDAAPGANPPLPAKLPMLLRLALRLWRTPVAVCAEQTSLWLPRLLPMRTRFIKVPHGAGTMMARDDPRRRAAWRIAVPSERERDWYLTHGFAAEKVTAAGYVKASFRQRTSATALFGDDRPVALYNPHWQQHRSSWWRWGPDIVRSIATDGRWNLIFAPHQRLAERAPDVIEVAREVADLPNVHCDLDSFATVDGSYTAAADIYLGDTSSQVIEFLARPRPCVFLNALGADWGDNAEYGMWVAGEVVDQADDVLAALDRAPARHAEYRDAQATIAREMLGDTSGAAPARCAGLILEALG